MMHNERPIVVFDLDGTLANTAPDLTTALNAVLTEEGLPPLSVEKVWNHIGSGARALILQGLHEAGCSSIDEAKLERMFQAFLAYYEAHLNDHTTLFPGVIESLDQFADEGWLLAVCTNKYEAHSLQLLEFLGISDRFAAICARDTFPFFKPDPRHLTLTIERAGGSIERAIMVGDSQTDIKTARAAGIPVVGVSFGYSDVPIADLGPDRLINHFNELWMAAIEITTLQHNPRKTLLS